MNYLDKRNIPISLPSIGQDEWEALREPIFSGWITQGPMVKNFELLFAERHKVKYSFAVSNCTTALHLALLAIGIEPGDEVLVPAFTWVSTANAILYCGARPVFVDIDLDTYNICLDDFKNKLTKKSKAVIAVHLFGLCADIPALRTIAPSLKIIEDGACAAGAELDGNPAGGLGDIGCFSFHPRKSVTTGEGGMLTTNSEEYAKRIDVLRNHGASISEEQRHKGPQPYILPEFDFLGYNYRMTDLQGALGVVQLKKLDSFINERNFWAEFYNTEFSHIDWLRTPKISKRFKHGWQSYVLFIDEAKSPLKRNDIMSILQDKGISTRPGTHAVHMLGYYRAKFGFKNEDYPNAYHANEFSMSIPLHNRMTKEDYEYVTNAIKSFL